MAVNQYDEFAAFRARVLKAYRSAIRLKYALLADDEIARTLPEVQASIDAAVLLGEPIALNPGQIFSETL